MNRKRSPNSRPTPAHGDGGSVHPTAVLWDRSHVWGLICVETLTHFGIPFHLLSAQEVASGCLDRYKVLLVPGGWASHKAEALGEAGKDRIGSFLRSGGSYLGFCGGAGLAMSSPPALGLVPLKRMTPSERLPNASGGVWVRGTPDHPAWKDLPPDLPVSVWWPSQFSLEVHPGALPLATYTGPGEDFWVADLPLGDLPRHDFDWHEREKLYEINLDPGRLMGHTAIQEIPLGRGRLVLSYPHLETPGDPWGNRLLLNVLSYLDREASRSLPGTGPLEPPPGRFDTPPGLGCLEYLSLMENAVSDLIAFGERHLLWQWRRPWLLRWRRGLRGLEYGALAALVRTIVSRASATATRKNVRDPWLEPAAELAEEVRSFCELAKWLLLEEKLASLTGSVKKLGKVNNSVDEMREGLFGNGMSPEGRCKRLFSLLEDFLLQLVRTGRDSS